MKDYDLIFVTNLPAFYKINLYNAIRAYRKILVIFIETGSVQRNNDFYKGEKKFDYIFLQGNKFAKIRQYEKIVFQTNYKELIIGGWDDILYWYSALRFDKSRNVIVMESSDKESATTGLRGFVKRFFLRRMSKAFVSGYSQAQLAHKLLFKGKIIKTKGVGIFNYIKQPPFSERTLVSHFIYVGRLSPEKNLKKLITVFNDLPELTLTIVGFGPLEKELKSIAKKNIIFTGAVDNLRLPEYYQRSDVFVLPSTSEVWGLVVEEAFNNGLPVLISNQVGCAEEIVKSRQNGLIFDVKDDSSLKASILKMTEVKFYNELRYNVSKMDFEAVEKYQIECYL